MKKFINKNSPSGKFTFQGYRIPFKGVLIAEDEQLINYLIKSDNWIEIEVKGEDKKEVKKEVKNSKSKVSKLFKQLKKDSDDLGLNYPEDISYEDLKKLFEEATNQVEA